jgi:hypothetical protein
MEKSLFAHITEARNALFDWYFEYYYIGKIGLNLKKQKKFLDYDR